MATTTESIVVTTREAKIILDWDDGHWYVADVSYTGEELPPKGSDTSTGGVVTTGSTGGGVKVPEWDQTYKYTANDIVAYNGVLYVSKQAQNNGNIPSSGTFWWGLVVNLTGLDAITLEGKNLSEIMRAVLGGNVISDYYKKSEVDNIVLSYFNSVNAKKLEDWSLNDIKTDYTTKIAAAEQRAKDHAVSYLDNDSPTGFDQSLVTLFNTSIAPDGVNRF